LRLELWKWLIKIVWKSDFQILKIKHVFDQPSYCSFHQLKTSLNGRGFPITQWQVILTTTLTIYTIDLSEQLVGFCNFLDKTCRNNHGFGMNLLDIQIEYRGFNIW
jgi:hypothetical protein